MDAVGGRAGPPGRDLPERVCDYSQPSVGNPDARTYLARFSSQMCAVLDHFVAVFGFDDVQDMIRNGVRGFGVAADLGRATPIAQPRPNEGACEVTTSWPEGDAARLQEIADAWGISVDQLHHGGGVILPFLVFVAARNAAA